MSIPGALRSKTSRVTIQNPRPRKYASAAEKQAAFRARFPTICVRVEQKTADTIQKIGDASGRTQQETMLSLVKFALTNRDFVNLGLTEHKQLPRMDETRKANPMKKQPSAAQIAARERFAEMARSGAFTRSKSKRKAKPKQSSDKNAMISQMILERVESGESLKSAYDAVLGKGAYDRFAGELYSEIRKTKSNPAKKTVSQKISQLTREGYPQKQAVAIALNEERKGKVKRNPISGQEAGEFRMTVNGKTVTRFFAHDNDPWANSYGFEYRLLSNVVKVGSPIRFTKSRAIVAIDEAADGSPVTETWEIRNLKFYQSNPRASNPTNFLKLPKYACIMPVSGGMMYGIDERTPVTIKFSNSELKSAYKCYLIPATVRESAGYRRMIAQGKTVYMSLAELKQTFRSFV